MQVCVNRLMNCHTEKTYFAVIKNELTCYLALQILFDAHRIAKTRKFNKELR